MISFYKSTSYSKRESYKRSLYEWESTRVFVPFFLFLSLPLSITFNKKENHHTRYIHRLQQQYKYSTEYTEEISVQGEYYIHAFISTWVVDIKGKVGRWMRCLYSVLSFRKKNDIFVSGTENYKSTVYVQ